MRIVVGVTGASGAIYGLRLLERLREAENTAGIDIHLVLSRSGEKTLFLETGKKAADLKSLVHYSWPVEDISAPLASGSFQTAGMIVCPGDELIWAHEDQLRLVLGSSLCLVVAYGRERNAGVFFTEMKLGRNFRRIVGEADDGAAVIAYRS